MAFAQASDIPRASSLSDPAKADQITLTKRSDAPRQTIEQIVVERSGTDYEISQAKGGFDRCDPALENRDACQDIRGAQAETIDASGDVLPEVELLRSIDPNRPNSVVDPVDAAERIGRGRPQGSDVAQAIGQDFLSPTQPAPVDPDNPGIDGLSDILNGLPPIVTTDSGGR